MLNDVAIRNFLIVLAGLVLMGIGVMILAKSQKAQFSEVAKTGVNTLIGLIILAAGAGSLLLVAFGQKLLETILPEGTTTTPTDAQTLGQMIVDLADKLPLS
ncbi:MAG TPA: hypothetical protein VIQ30_19190 [Pseudonocardia sp.]